MTIDAKSIRAKMLELYKTDQGSFLNSFVDNIHGLTADQLAIVLGFDLVEATEKPVNYYRDSYGNMSKIPLAESYEITFTSENTKENRHKAAKAWIEVWYRNDNTPRVHLLQIALKVIDNFNNGLPMVISREEFEYYMYAAFRELPRAGFEIMPLGKPDYTETTQVRTYYGPVA